MDENQIGPNINTTPVRRYVRDGPYPSGKAVPPQLGDPRLKPQGGQSATLQAGPRARDTMGKLLFLFLLLFFLL